MVFADDSIGPNADDGSFCFVYRWFDLMALVKRVFVVFAIVLKLEGLRLLL